MERKPVPRWPWFVLAAVLLLVAALAAVLFPWFWPRHWSFESAAELNRVRRELPAAQARWQAHGVTDYDITVHGAYSLACITPLTIHVRGGQMVPPQQDCDYPRFNLRVVSSLVAPGGFQTIGREVNSFDPAQNYLSVHFDPEYGYISDYVWESNSYHVSSCCTRLSFSDFKPILP